MGSRYSRTFDDARGATGEIVASDESVIDLMTGTPLKFQEVSGQEARDAGAVGLRVEGVDEIVAVRGELQLPACQLRRDALERVLQAGTNLYVRGVEEGA